MDSFLEAVEHPDLQRLYRYWDARRGARAMPSRADLDPLDFSYVLGHIMLVEAFDEPLRFRVRLHGSHLVHRLGSDMTGKFMEDYPDVEYGRVAVESFSTVVETKLPFRSTWGREIAGKWYDYETIMLPLSSDGATVDMILIALLYIDLDPH